MLEREGPDVWVAPSCPGDYWTTQELGKQLLSLQDHWSLWRMWLESCAEDRWSGSVLMSWPTLLFAYSLQPLPPQHQASTRAGPLMALNVSFLLTDSETSLWLSWGLVKNAVSSNTPESVIQCGGPRPSAFLNRWLRSPPRRREVVPGPHLDRCTQEMLSNVGQWKGIRSLT